MNQIRPFLRQKHHNPISFEIMTFIKPMAWCGELWRVFPGKSPILNTPRQASGRPCFGGLGVMLWCDVFPGVTRG